MIEKGLELIKNSKKIVFMTGAGVSTASGIPDYRSMTGVYQGHENPEYLLSHTCLMSEPEKFYDFVKGLYHEEARPNVIHEQMRELEKAHEVSIISQNIDGLHNLAKSSKVVNFHGNLNDLYCLKCQKSVPTKEYLTSYIHKNCGGMVRPNVVLYEEGLSEEAIQTSIKWLSQADLVVIVGTTFKVYPFSGLIDYRNPSSDVLVINYEEINLYEPFVFVKGSAEEFLKVIRLGDSSMLEKPRMEINKIDQEIVTLLEKRYACVDEVVRIKKENKLPTLDSKREEEVLARLSKMVIEKEYEEAILNTFQSIMDISKEYQKSKNK